MPGERLPKGDYKISSEVPASGIKRIPRSLPVFRYTLKARAFETNTLQALLGQSSFSGTNIADVLRSLTNKDVVRLASLQGPERFYFNPGAGAVNVVNRDSGVDFRKETPAYDDVPSFDAIGEKLFRYAQAFGISTNELQRDDKGAIVLKRTDDTTISRGGAVKFINRRSVAVLRSAAGYPFLASRDRIELVLGVKGRLLKFETMWPSMEAVGTNSVFSLEQVVENIRRGEVFADETNQYPEGGISEIVLKDLRVFYLAPDMGRGAVVSTNTDIVPIVSFYVVFKSKSGNTTEGGLLTHLVKP